jgi:hypothetical protein
MGQDATKADLRNEAAIASLPRAGCGRVVQLRTAIAAGGVARS